MGQPTEIAGAIAAYSQVTGKFRTYDATAPVSVHHHDYAWPTGSSPARSRHAVGRVSQVRHDKGLIAALDASPATLVTSARRL